MSEPTSGSSGTRKSTEFPVVDLAVTAVVVDYVAEAIARRAGDVQLLIPTTRKRRRPILIHVSNELLCRLMELRGSPAGSYTDLLERNGRQSAIIQDYVGRLRDMQEQNKDLNARLDELANAYVKRGLDLEALRQNFECERDTVSSLKRRCEQMGDAIRMVTNPVDSDKTWKEAYAGIVEALKVQGYHVRSTHSYFSWGRWFGCERCMPEWMLSDVTVMTYDQTASARLVVAAVYRKVARILRPAVTESVGLNLLQNREAAKPAVNAPGASGTGDADVSVTG